MRIVTGYVLIAGALLAGCSQSGPERHRVRGSVTGLVGTGLRLTNNGTDSATVARGATAFDFPSLLETGAAYSVEIAAQPEDPPQTCRVSGGAGQVGTSDVVVTVTCGDRATHAVGGAVAGLTSTGLKLHLSTGADLSVAPGASRYAFPPILSGSSYVVTVAEQPSGGIRCAVERGTGVVGDADVTDADVTCGHTVGGTFTRPPADGLVLQDSGGDDLAVTAGQASFTFRRPVPAGGTYAVTVKVPPTGQSCSIAHGSGQVGDADVTNVAITCDDVVVQRWTPPQAWGPSTVAPASSVLGWTDSDPHLVQHAVFDGSSIVETKGIAWTAQGGTPAQRQLGAFPGGPRWGAGPFPNQRFQAASEPAGGVPSLTGDMLACAVLKPDYNPVEDGLEQAILAKGMTGADPMALRPGGGWVLMQMHEQFCLHYHYLSQGCDTSSSPAGDRCMTMVYTPTYFANGRFQTRQTSAAPGPLDASYVVLCGGRDGSSIRIAANSIESLGERTLPSGAVLDLGTTPFPLTIGGYTSRDFPSCATSPHPCQDNSFLGRVYETAVWNVPATVENIQAKLAAVQGLLLADGRAATYRRNREGPFVGVDGALHATWRHGPRLDPALGMLFGVQGWNRLTRTEPYAGSPYHPFDVFAAGEDPGLWSAGAGASISSGADVAPPGDGEQLSARAVSLAPGAALTTGVLPFEAAGPVQGQLWIRPTSSGVLRVSLGGAQGGGSTTFDVDLSSRDGAGAPRYPVGQWTRVALTGLTSDGSSAATLTLSNAGAAPLEFRVWGVSLTQIGGGGDLGAFDAGPYSYDWSAREGIGYDPATDLYSALTESYPQDVLELPRPGATGGAGYCLSVDARPFTRGAADQALAWDAPMHASRTALTWVSDPPASAASASLYVTGVDDAPGRQICFLATGMSAPSCAAAPAGWAPGSRHNLKGCVSAAGAAQLFLDDRAAGSQQGGAAVVDLANGHLLVGNAVAAASARARPWHGWVSGVVACRDPGPGQVSGCR